MAFTVPQEAEGDTLEALVTLVFSVGSKMRLYAGNIIPGPTTTLASVNATEATFTGYVPYVLSSWSPVTIDGSGAATSGSTGIFTPSGGGSSGNIYGYYMSDSPAANWYGAERFGSAPIVIPSGISLVIQLTYTLLTRF